MKRRLSCLMVGAALCLGACGGGGGGGGDDSDEATGTIAGRVTIDSQEPSALAQAQPARLRDDWRVRIHWQQDTPRLQRRVVLEAHGLQACAVSGFCRARTIRARAASSLYRALSAEPAVAAVSIVPPVRASFVPADPAWPANDTTGSPGQWGMRLINMPAAWETTRGSAEVTVAVLDSGINPSHPEFSGRLRDGYDFISDPALAQDGDGRDGDPTDVQAQRGEEPSHGSHVAGIIAAAANDIGTVGVAHQCQIMPLRVLGGLLGDLEDILDALIYAGRLQEADLAGFAWYDTFLPNGLDPNRPQPSAPADVINMSLG
ncbi:MAG: S8 family serine peptidase, partial [Planctomycetota bacterium]